MIARLRQSRFTTQTKDAHGAPLVGGEIDVLLELGYANHSTGAAQVIEGVRAALRNVWGERGVTRGEKYTVPDSEKR